LLEELWIELGDFRGVFDVSLRALGHARGISTSAKVRALLEKFIPARAGIRPIELAVVVTNLDGEVDLVGSELATTFERCLRFSGSDFASDEGLARVFEAVVASAAFPVVFEPVTMTIGARRVRCVDGGACNNTPIKYALGDGADIDRIFIVAPFPSVQRASSNIEGVALLSQLGDALVQESYLELRVIRRPALAVWIWSRPRLRGRGGRPDNDDRSISAPVRLIARCHHGSIGPASRRSGRRAAAHRARGPHISTRVVGSRGNAGSAAAIRSLT
jgi:hypothetical protein